MEQFMTWELLFDWVTLVATVLGLTQFTKDIKFIKKIPTKYWSFFIALFLIVISNIQANNFKLIDLVLYTVSAVFISMNANGIYDFKKTKKESD